VTWAIAIAPLSRIATAAAFGNHSLNAYFTSVQDGLATGCLLAMIWPQLEAWSEMIDRWIIAIVAVTVVLPVLKLPHGLQPLIGFSIINIGIALCIHHCIRRQYRLLNAAPVVWIGTLSYSLYLWQQPFLREKSIYHAASLVTTFPVNIVCALLTACACHYGIEKPFLALRAHRFQPKTIHVSETVSA
jgi:peptidoglycan/LPS O-acetylase OafA/YrhL